jgi:hypothetical protein
LEKIVPDPHITQSPFWGQYQITPTWFFSMDFHYVTAAYRPKSESCSVGESVNPMDFDHLTMNVNVTYHQDFVADHPLGKKRALGPPRPFST